jgi:hypothetical protein
MRRSLPARRDRSAARRADRSRRRRRDRASRPGGSDGSAGSSPRSASCRANPARMRSRRAGKRGSSFGWCGRRRRRSDGAREHVADRVEDRADERGAARRPAPARLGVDDRRLAVADPDRHSARGRSCTRRRPPRRRPRPSGRGAPGSRRTGRGSREGTPISALRKFARGSRSARRRKSMVRASSAQ